MIKYKKAYLGLGSNLGDKLTHLNYAAQQLFNSVGNITAISKVYKTPAFGFEGNAFYNACVEINTILTPSQLLSALQRIEKTMGRIKASNAYENRPIDLDIIFFDNETIQTDDLCVPHKHMHTRDFVLYPLSDIAPQAVHPILNLTVKDLKTRLKGSKIEVVDKHLKFPKPAKTDLMYICIEGNIGAGKTTFAKMFSQDYKAKLILERFKDNPFLPQFYQDPKRFAFPTEMSFLADRHQQLVEDIAQLDLFSSLCIADYDLYKSLIFAEITLQPEEFQLYKKIFNIIYKEIPKPDMYVYFYQTTDNLLKNIEKRGRSFEQNISADYLDEINEGYLNFIKQQTKFDTKVIDITNKNFIDQRSDYLEIIEQILN